MSTHDLNGRYFQWMYQLMCNGRYGRTSYRKLFMKLYHTPFTYFIPLDDNRAADGIDLRYRFGREKGYSDALIASYLDDKPCSVLEMMVALAIRCEEHIMEDDEIGDRTGQWFWNMIVSLGLGQMDDTRYDMKYVSDVLNRFLERDYARNGKGGLFTIEYCPHDMRSIDIWYQLCLYLNEII